MKKYQVVITISLILMVFGSVLAHAIQTGGGKIKVNEVKIAINNGEIVTGVLYTPEGASAATPAPAVLALHGSYNTAGHQSPYAIELSRRGYIVLAVNYGAHAYTEFISGAVDAGATACFDYLAGLPMVDKTKIAIEGHSYGGIIGSIAAIQRMDLVNSLVMVAAYTAVPLSPEVPYNIALIADQYDEFALYGEVAKSMDAPKSESIKSYFGTTDDIVPEKLYGSFGNETARIMYTPKMNHVALVFTAEPIANTIDFLNQAMPSEKSNSIDPFNQVWKWHEIGTLMGLLGMVLSIFGFGAYFIHKKEFFGELRQEATRGAGIKGIPWVAAIIIFAAIIPLTYQHFFRWFGETFYDGVTEGLFVETKATWFTKLWPQQYTTAIIGWTLGFTAIMVIIFVIYHFATLKNPEQKGDMVAYGLSTNVEKPELKWFRIGKAFLLAAAIVGVPYILLLVLNKIFVVDFRFLVIPFMPMDFKHFGMFLLYLIPLAIGYIAISAVLLRVRVNKFSSDKANTIATYAVNWFVLCSGLIVYVILQYTHLSSTGITRWVSYPIGPMLGIMCFQLIPLFTVVSFISTYFQRKTANVYTGAFINAMLITWYMVMMNPVLYCPMPTVG
ncbi:MAG TPA: hypothetical protein GXX75_24790 [Clostridiales bacterium]|nr:hypothetical protein [Clostridiales bacterium]